MVCLAGDLPHGPHVSLRVAVADSVAWGVGRHVGARVGAGVGHGTRVAIHALGPVGFHQVGVLHSVDGLHGDGVVAASVGLLLQALAVLHRQKDNGCREKASLPRLDVYRPQTRKGSFLSRSSQVMRRMAV